VGTASVSGTTLIITGVAAGTAQITVFDSSGASVNTNVTVSTGTTPTALYINAASTITIAPSTASNYAIGGGTAPYSVSSSNTSVVTASVSGTTLTVTGAAAGAAQITVFDSKGASVNTVVTVSTGVAPTALYATAPSAVTIAVSGTSGYTIGGGSAPYAVSSSNIGVATASVSGTSLTITGVAAGTAQVSVLDLTGTAVRVTVTVGSGSVATLYITAPSAVTVAVGDHPSYTVGGGSAPYTVSSSNTNIVTATVSGTTLTVNGVAAGTAQVSVFDLLGNSVPLTVTVGTGSASTLYMTAPSAITVAPLTTSTYLVGGGTPLYSVSTSNAKVATAAVVGTTLTVNAIAAGTAQITVFDATGKSVNTLATVSSGAAATTLYVTAPSAVTVAIGATPNPTYTIGGGTGPYVGSSSNTDIATASVSGTTLTITGVAVGVAQLKVFDATGAAVTVSVTVGSGSAATLYMTAPSTITLAVSDASTYTVGGGIAPYSVSTSNKNVATVGIDQVTKILTITSLATGTAQISVFDSTGKSVSTSVNVGSGSVALFTTAPSAVTAAVGPLDPYIISGGTAPYRVSSNNPAVATVLVDPDGKTLKITALSVGVAQISVTDGVGASVKVSVTVGGSGLALSTTAPSSITVAIGGSPSYAISGGTTPYTVTSSNTSIATTATTDDSVGAKLIVKGMATGSAIVVVRDAANATVSLTVNVGSANALYTTAPSAVTVTVGVASPYTISGGVGPYKVSSSNPSVTNATLSDPPDGNTLNIPGTAVGVAQVLVFDSTGKSVTVNVTVVSASSATPLYTTAPASVTIDTLGTGSYTIGGGTSPYDGTLPTSSNASVATATVNGTSLTIKGVAAGSATITVRDAANAVVSVNVTVGSATALFTTAPSLLTIAVGQASPTYAVSGGSQSYSASSGNTNVATASVSNITSLLTITGVAVGSTQISVMDSTGKAVAIAVTVGSGSPGALFTTAPSAITIAKSAVSTYAISGGTGPYAATSSNASFATTTGTAGTVLQINGVAAGSVSIVVSDSVGATKTIAVTVTPVLTTPLTVLPNAVTGAVGDVLAFSISGGSSTYFVTANNSSIASVSVPIAGKFSATLLNVGTTTVAIADDLGQTTTLSLTVNAAVPTLRLSPSAVTVGENYTGLVVMSIYGGQSGATYTAYTSDLVLSNVVVVPGTPAQINVGLGSATNRCIAPIAPATTYDVTITVVDNLGASAISVMTIKDHSGATCP